MIAQHLKFFESLNKNKVEYLLIGGTLAIAYGVPRVTKDIDIPALHLDDLIKSKQAAGREEDLQDIKILEMARKAKK